jgi:heme exporter protein B
MAGAAADGGGARGMTGALLAVMRRDFRLLLRAGGGFGLPLVFFLSSALLATLIGLDRLFGADAEDGSLDLLFAAPAPLPALVLAKVAAHWVATGLPLAAAAPLLGLLLNMPPGALASVTLTLLIGTPALALLGAVGAALTVGLKRGGLLLPVLVMPLTVPVLIFGVSATETAVTGGSYAAFALLGGIALGALVLAPIAAAAALRGALQ